MTIMKTALVASLAAAALTLGCSDSTTAPSTGGITSTTTQPTTETVSSLLYPLDAQLKWVNISGTNGAITATLVSAPAGVVVGLGIGLRANGCLLTRSVNATSGTQLSVPVEA